MEMPTQFILSTFCSVRVLLVFAITDVHYLNNHQIIYIKKSISGCSFDFKSPGFIDE